MHAVVLLPPCYQPVVQLLDMPAPDVLPLDERQLFFPSDDN
jgi:hypothetical protein